MLDGVGSWTALDFSEALTAARMAPWRYDAARRDLLRTPEINQLLGLPPAAQPSLEEIANQLMPGERARLQTAVLDAVRRHPHFLRIDFRLRRFDGAVRWFLLRAETRLDAAGRLVSIVGMLIDLTDRKLEELENAHLASVVKSTPYAVLSVDATRRITSWNAGATATFGFGPDEAIGAPMAIIVPDDDHPFSIAKLEAALSGRTVTREARRRHKSGRLIPVKVTIAPILGPDGEVVAASAIYEDLSEAKASQARQDLLIRELHHRVRNTLATVQGIAGVTAAASSTIQDFRDAFTQRIAALARTHAQLTEASSQAVGVLELVRQELGPFAAAGRIAIDGPHVALDSQVAPMLAMAIHELATNAAKHGALRDDDGALSIVWEAEGGWATLTWSERGPVPGRRPTRAGFGTTLLEHVLPAQFGAPVERRFGNDGVCVILRFPIPEVRNSLSPVNGLGLPSPND